MTALSTELTSVVTLLLVLITTFHCGGAIMCYDCNSAYDPRCGDPFDPFTLGIVNCSLQQRLVNPERLINPTLCRKTTQKVYGQVRVIRGCGYITDARDNGACMRKTGTHDVSSIFCSCTSDLCNSAGTKLPSILVMAGTAILSLRSII